MAGLPAANGARIMGTHSDAGWSSPVARRAHNPKVAGSNPAPATIRRPRSATWAFAVEKLRRRDANVHPLRSTRTSVGRSRVWRTTQYRSVVAIRSSTSCEPPGEVRSNVRRMLRKPTVRVAINPEGAANIEISFGVNRAGDVDAAVGRHGAQRHAGARHQRLEQEIARTCERGVPAGRRVQAARTSAEPVSIEQATSVRERSPRARSVMTAASGSAR